MAARARRPRRRHPRNYARIRHRPPRPILVANSLRRNLASLHSPTRRRAHQLRLRLPRRSPPRPLRHLPFHPLPRSSRPARHHLAPTRRVSRKAPHSTLVHQAPPLDLPLEQARSHPAHRLLRIARPRPLQHIHHTRKPPSLFRASAPSVRCSSPSAGPSAISESVARYVCAC